MSATIETPKGLDTLTADDRKLLDAMRADDDGADPGPEPAPATRPAPAAVEEPPELEIEPDAPAADPAPAKMVPHQALHAERERRKAVEAQLRTAETKTAAEMARLQERVNVITSIAQVATAPAPVTPAAAEPLPDVNVDPVGHFRAVAENTQRELNDVKAIVRGWQEGQQRNQQIVELRNWGAAQEKAFEAQEPAYPAAMAHLEQSRRTELTKIGVTDPAEQQRIIGTDIHNIAVRSRQEGANFAERLYALAEARGYQKTAPAAAPAAAPTGIAIPPLDAPAAERAAAARDNATTIGSLGAAPPTRLSVAKIAEMNDKDFAALVSRYEKSGADIRDLMGY